MVHKLHLKKGFTLTELLIVILIIALLMAFILPQLLRGPAQARDAVRVNHLNQLAVALEGYKNAQGTYPISSGECLSTSSIAGNELIKKGSLTANNFPKDPLSNNKVDICTGEYYYKTIRMNEIDNNGFLLSSRVENKNSGNSQEDGSTLSSSPTLKKGDGDFFIKLSE